MTRNGEYGQHTGGYIMKCREQAALLFLWDAYFTGHAVVWVREALHMKVIDLGWLFLAGVDVHGGFCP